MISETHKLLEFYNAVGDAQGYILINRSDGLTTKNKSTFTVRTVPYYILIRSKYRRILTNAREMNI